MWNDELLLIIGIYLGIIRRWNSVSQNWHISDLGLTKKKRIWKYVYNSRFGQTV